MRDAGGQSVGEGGRDSRTVQHRIRNMYMGSPSAVDDELLAACDSKRDPCLQRRRAFMVTGLAAHGHWRWAGDVSGLGDEDLHVNMHRPSEDTWEAGRSRPSRS